MIILRILFFILVICLFIAQAARPTHAQSTPAGPDAPSSIAVNHVIWVWFENREQTQITPVTAPRFASFAASNLNLTNYFGVAHPSQPNYLAAFSGSAQGVIDDSHVTFPASTNNLAKQLSAAGRSWRLYAQDYPGGCSDVDTFNGGVDGPGVAGPYARKHNPAVAFESVRLTPSECANIQSLANFDPTVNFAFVVPNMINDMHDGASGPATTAGDQFLQTFLPLVTSSPDWAHTLLIVTFDEGTTSTGGGGHIYTAAAAPWLVPQAVATTYNHFSMLRTTEQVFGLPFLGGAATAATMNELLPSPTTQEVSISGRILTRDGRGVRVAAVSIVGAQGLTRTFRTGPYGTYSIPNVVTGQTYTISAASRRFSFSPRTVAVDSAMSGVDLIAN